MPAHPGDVIADKYRVRDVIGHGGVGVVFAADHMTLHRPVALKFLRADVAQDTESVQRFLREARAAAQLRSEHVARVLDADESEGGQAYLVMELLEGRDFAAILDDDGPLPVGEAVDYVMQACEAVAEAHSLGIVHRDIKSANLFLTRGAGGAPLVKVLDFGLSRIESSESGANLTSANHVMGTPHFMSPEQMRSSRDVDARSDIWGLGVVLYAFLAGRVPFAGRNLTEVCAAVLSGAAPSLTSLRPEVPAGLAEVVGRCIRLEPAERFQSVAELVAALEPYALPASAARVARVERLAGAGWQGAPGERAPLASRGTPHPFELRRVLAWSVAIIGLFIAVEVIALLHRASAGDSASSATVSRMPPVVESPRGVAAPPVVSSDPGAVVQPEAPAMQPPPAPRVAPRRPAAAGARRTAAPPPPQAHSSRPRTEEDVIMGLPH